MDDYGWNPRLGGQLKAKGYVSVHAVQKSIAGVTGVGVQSFYLHDFLAQAGETPARLETAVDSDLVAAWITIVHTQGADDLTVFEGYDTSSMNRLNADTTLCPWFVKAYPDGALKFEVMGGALDTWTLTLLAVMIRGDL